VLLDRQQVLLERRPAPGIWGGLWSFPEAPARDIESYCRRTFGCEIKTRRELDALEHGFTHFRLRIRPLLCEVSRAKQLEALGRLWVDLDDASSAAVPTPVKKLLGQLKGLR
jgi:A/G-specific adenine glycosylase